jgi:hypothetical protein
MAVNMQKSKTARRRRRTRRSNLMKTALEMEHQRLKL